MIQQLFDIVICAYFSSIINCISLLSFSLTKSTCSCFVNLKHLNFNLRYILLLYLYSSHLSFECNRSISRAFVFEWGW